MEGADKRYLLERGEQLMRPLFVTWEYPPIKAGGIANHCEDLAQNLVAQGHEPVVITQGDTPGYERRNGVDVYRVTTNDAAPNTLSWSMQFGFEVERKAIELQKEDEFDFVHAHDWMAVPGATGIKKSLKKPMTFTVHSTQSGRDGIKSEYQRAIQRLEWYGTYEASEVITVGKDLFNEVKHDYGVPDDKMHFIPNGVDLERFSEGNKNFDRSDYALPHENIVTFLGRLYPQKGPSYLIKAMPKILREHPDTKFVFAGSGNLDEYRAMAKNLVGDKAHFTGFIPEKDLVSLLKNSLATTAPSVYEPFGLVPLESSACNTPPIASYVGGMKETVVHEYTGLHTYPKDPKSIAEQVSRALRDPDWTNWLGDNAREYVEEHYKWDKVAEDTANVYNRALNRA